jgi:hypothetical protein
LDGRVSLGSVGAIFSEIDPRRSWPPPASVAGIPVRHGWCEHNVFDHRHAARRETGSGARTAVRRGRRRGRRATPLDRYTIRAISLEETVLFHEDVALLKPGFRLRNGLIGEPGGRR